MNHTSIILTTLNARYVHASLGLRYLYANLSELQAQSRLIEFTIKTPIEQIVDQLAALEPKIVGFGVYIWNVDATTKVIRALKQLKPEIVIVIGGPEVSHEYDNEDIFQLCDYLITGQGDLEFKRLCQNILNNLAITDKVISPRPFALADLNSPYPFYNTEDITHRLIYVEASRGCPFKCEFCLSSLDKTAYPFNLDKFLSQMNELYDRGARTFKFVDRTFNLKIATSIKILEFFLDRISDDLFLHFELIPDNLPDPLKNLLVEFPPGSLQFEIGIQTFTEEAQALIGRRQNNEKAKENIRWLKQNTHAHLHTDLIFGLPGESLESFTSSFNQLATLGPDEIQLGILKRLRGTPIIRHTESYGLKFNNLAPYTIQSTSLIDESIVSRMQNFSRFWDKIYNSGRFNSSIDMLLGSNPFANFWRLSDHLYANFERSHSIQLEDLFLALEDYYFDNPNIMRMLLADEQRSKIKIRKMANRKHSQRQFQHLAANSS